MWAIINNALLSRNMSMYALAKKLKIRPSTVYSWKNQGFIPKTDDLIAVAKVLDLDVTVLLEAR